MRVLCAFLLSSVALLLSACAGMPVLTTSNTDSVPGTVLHGSVHGGQNPIVGAHVYLYAINNTGYGGPGIAPSSTNASVSLLRSAANTTQDGSGNYYVTTDPYGNFTITNDYTCPSNYAHTYYYASGGDPGSGLGRKLGHHAHGSGDACNTSASTDINEVSTIVTAYVFAGFASDPLHVSSSNTALASTGLANAANTLANLEDLNLSVALATTPGAQRHGAAAGDQHPRQHSRRLRQLHRPRLHAVLHALLQRHQQRRQRSRHSNRRPQHRPQPSRRQRRRNLFGLQTPDSPFQPSLPSTPVPNDFTIAISYSGAG